MLNGEVGILNVGAGDIRLNFNSKDPADVIRAKRIVVDMLRRGYALLVEVEREGVKAYERAIDFNETTAEYIIADFDPVQAEEVDAWSTVNHVTNQEELKHGEGSSNIETAPPEKSTETTPEKTKKGRPKKYKQLPAGETKVVAVGRSAGG